MLFKALKLIMFVLFTACLFIIDDLSAGSGWYLLEPPLRLDINEEEILKSYPNLRDAPKAELHDIIPMFMGDWKAPLSKWTHIGSFDTAIECEAALKRIMDAAKAEEPELRRKYPDGYPTLKLNLLRSARCIGSDDPRLIK